MLEYCITNMQDAASVTTAPKGNFIQNCSMHYLQTLYIDGSPAYVNYLMQYALLKIGLV